MNFKLLNFAPFRQPYVARPLAGSVVNQTSLFKRAHLLFGDNSCCKFSWTGAQNYAISSRIQVNPKLKFSTRYEFLKFQT